MQATATRFRYVREDEVRAALPMAQAIALVKQALRDRAEGRAVDVPRERAKTPKGHLHIVQGAAPVLSVVGFKAYYLRPAGKSFLLVLIDQETGLLEGMVEAQWLGAMRTGAASGVATNLLAAPDASVVACLGAGLQAETQLAAVCAVRSVREVRVFSRSRDRADDFCRRLSVQLEISMCPSGIAEAVAGAHIVNVCTRASEPVLLGELLEPGQHVNAAGVNSLTRREIDLETVRRAGLVVVDSVEVARREAGDLLPAVEAGLLHWEALPELGQLLAGQRSGRTSEDQITLFESHGMGIEDIYCGKWVLDASQGGAFGTWLEPGSTA